MAISTNGLARQMDTGTHRDTKRTCPGGVRGDDRGHTPLGVSPCPVPHGRAKPARLPLGTFYARMDRCGRKYLSGRLGLMKLMLLETPQTSEGEVVWERVLVEGPHVSDDQHALAAQV